MSHPTLAEKTVFLEQKCDGITLSTAQENDFQEILGLENILVGIHHKQEISQSQHSTYFVYRNGCIQGAVGIKRALYEKGTEVPYDGRDNYINKIEFLAVSVDSQDNLPSVLVARTILDIGGKNLFVADTTKKEAEEIFKDLAFSQLTGFDGGPKRYAYLLEDRKEELEPEKPHLDLPSEEYANRLPEYEMTYHAGLREHFDFDIIHLIKKSWTAYRYKLPHGRDEQEFIFVLTTGETQKFKRRQAFKLDVYDSKDGSFVGYNDIFVSIEDFALNDTTIRDFPSEIPETLKEHLGRKCQLDVQRANSVRMVGLHVSDAIWVRPDYRGSCIGEAMERIAGDVCKLAYPKITKIGVTLSMENIRNAHQFHTKAGAVSVRDPLYLLEYRLNDAKRSQINILYGL